ncbi:hypothetical protein CN997_25305 [Bacillus cereus]|nr:hypothetical protein CN997_25305 [Bacillus cereus]
MVLSLKYKNIDFAFIQTNNKIQTSLSVILDFYLIITYIITFLLNLLVKWPSCSLSYLFCMYKIYETSIGSNKIHQVDDNEE